MWWWLGTLGLLVLRLALAACLPLGDDEGYYWVWSRHLAAGYHDHPPMVAWLVAVSTRQLGVSLLSLRLPFVLLGTAAALTLRVLVQEVTGDRRLAARSALLFQVVPVFFGVGIFVIPDAPLQAQLGGARLSVLAAPRGAGSGSLAGACPARGVADGDDCGCAGDRLRCAQRAPWALAFRAAAGRRRPHRRHARMARGRTGGREGDGGSEGHPGGLEPFVAAGRYQNAARLEFYLPGHPQVFCLNPGRDAYDDWQDLETLRGRDFVFVASDRFPIPAERSVRLRSSIRFAAVRAFAGPDAVHTITIYQCRGYQD